jgi:hypothetical protein
VTFGKLKSLKERGKNSRRDIQVSKRMAFYCAGAIRGDVSYRRYFDKIVEIVGEYGEPKTERFGYTPLTEWTEAIKKRVYERDKRWIRESRALIAECSGPSYGTGAEVMYATRVLRIPALGLYHASSLPSLMLTQDNSKYTFPQEYSNEKDLENYLRLFLEVVTRFDYIDDIRMNYLKARKVLDPNFNAQQISALVESLPKQPVNDLIGIQGKLELDIERITVVRPKQARIDFKDSKDFVEFMFKNLILQKRWDRLESQRIGTTFASGRKSRIIEVLSRLDAPTDLLQIYKRQGEDRLGYTREAFTKNVRAFRRIGLFEVPVKVESLSAGTTKFRDQIVVIKTLYGRFNIESSRSPREIMRNLIIVTQHLQHLSEFLQRFSSGSLVRLLTDAKEKSWYSAIPDVPILNIDKVDISAFLENKWGQQLVAYLHAKCKDLWKKEYSSFA